MIALAFTTYELGESESQRVHALAARIDEFSLGFAVAKTVFLPNSIGLVYEGLGKERCGFRRERSVGRERKNDLFASQSVTFGFICSNLAGELN